MQIARWGIPIAVALMIALHASVFAQSLNSGEISINAGWPGYGALDLRGVPIARSSSLQVYEPGWKQGYFSSEAHKPSVKRQADALSLHFEIDRKAKFDGIETYRSVAENHVERTLTGRLDGPTSTANVEWTLGYINAFPLYGGSLGDGKTEVSIRPMAQSPDKDGTVIPAAKSITLSTRIGKLIYTIEEGDFQLSLLDGRLGKEKWWGKDSPTFWLGILAGKIEPAKPFTCRVSIKFEPAPRSTTVAEADSPSKGKLVTLKNAFKPEPKPLLIIPKPKKLVWTKSHFSVDATTTIVVEDARAQRAAEITQRDAKERFGWDWKIANDRVSRGAIRFASATDGLKPEGYTIDCSEKAVVIGAIDAVGFFYAAQSLSQIFQTTDRGVTIAGCAISDYPSLAFRGVHLFTGKDAMPLHRKLVDRIFARYKFNHLVLEADYTQWQTNPQLMVDRSVPKEQLREYVKLARDNFLEPIPLVQSLGHAEWMFTNGQNTDLAEDPKARYAYAVTNPRTYDFIEKIYAETLEIFQSKYFHIGHDEVNMIGGYPHREEAKQWGATKLFTYDVNKLNDFFKPKGVTPMLWGDMLLDRSESNDSSANANNLEDAKARRGAIPKQAVICDWHYEPAKPEAFKSLKVFKDEGFKTIACTWYTPENIYSFSRAANLYGAWGLLQTTWAGYSVDEKSLQTELRQFTPYILAAEYAWNSDAPPPDQLPYRTDEMFIRAMSPRPQRTAKANGFQVDLSGLVTTTLNDLIGIELTPTKDRVDGFSFAKGREVILSGALTNAKRAQIRTVEISIESKAEELGFLQSCAFRAHGGDEVGTYAIRYEDGSEESIPIVYGKNVRAWDDSAATSEAIPAGANGPRLMTWVNPHPEKSIRSIRFSTSHAYASPMLCGITGLTK